MIQYKISEEYYRYFLDKLQEGIWNMIVIDGVVGVGKSTLMEILTQEGYIPFREPVEENPLLDKFYYDRKRYAFPLQVYFLNRRFKQIKEASALEKAVLDRSIYGDVIFAKMLSDQGDMEKAEFALYEELLENMLEHLKAPKLMIYLESSVDAVVKKIQKRGREYELVVENEYWQTLNREYTEYFKTYNKSPLLTINVDNLDFEHNKEDREYVLGLIHDKLATIENL